MTKKESAHASVAITDTQAIPEGQRNTPLASLAGAMRRQGCSQEAIFSALITANQRQCVPPLGYEELRRIAESISSYEPVPQDGAVLADCQHDTIAKAFETACIRKHKHQIETWAEMADKKYRIVDERELKKQIRRFASDGKVRKKIRTENGFAWRNERVKVNPHTVNGIAEALSALDGVWLPPEKQSPAWGGDRQG